MIHEMIEDNGTRKEIIAEKVARTGTKYHALRTTEATEHICAHDSMFGTAHELMVRKIVRQPTAAVG